MFSLRNVHYKDILHIENLDIKRNWVTSIVGESGSGKTTLLRLLNKLTGFDSGEITFRGTSLKDWNSVELRRSVVMLAQDPAIFPGSIRDNLLIGLRFAEKPPVSDERLKEVMMSVNVQKDLEENAGRLSGGEKQRVALGRVLLLEPEVLLLDEPSSALDEETERLVIRSLVNYARDNDRTLIMVSHSRRIAKEFSDEVVEIHRGKTVSRRED